MTAFDVVVGDSVRLAGVPFLLALVFAQHLYVGDVDCVQVTPARVAWFVN